MDGIEKIVARIKSDAETESVTANGDNLDEEGVLFSKLRSRNTKPGGICANFRIG